MAHRNFGGSHLGGERLLLSSSLIVSFAARNEVIFLPDNNFFHPFTYFDLLCWRISVLRAGLLLCILELGVNLT